MAKAFFLTARTVYWTIHLESAAFMFHMSITTQGITGSLRAACSDPVQRFLACPFQLTKTDAPNTRVSLTPPRALLADIAGRLPFMMERTHF